MKNNKQPKTTDQPLSHNFYHIFYLSFYLIHFIIPFRKFGLPYLAKEGYGSRKSSATQSYKYKCMLGLFLFPSSTKL